MGLKDLFGQSDNEAPLSSLRGFSENGPRDENEGPIGKVLAGADETKPEPALDPKWSDPTLITIQTPTHPFDLPTGQSEGDYISLDEMESRKQDGYGSAEALLKELQPSNSVMIDGNIYRIPVGTDLTAILGEPVYPDLETALKANPIEYEADEVSITGDVYKAKHNRDRYGIELADELAEHDCLLGPDGAVYKLPDDFTPEMIHAVRKPILLNEDIPESNMGIYAGIRDVRIWELNQEYLMDDQHREQYVNNRQPTPTFNSYNPFIHGISESAKQKHESEANRGRETIDIDDSNDLNPGNGRLEIER